MSDLPQCGSEESIHQLASLLSSSGKYDFHTLPLKRYMNQKDNGRYAFLFDFPSGASQSEPVSLSDLIKTKKSSDRLNLPNRFIVAQTIAKAITAFHADGWAHKSIRSQSIKFFQNNGSLQRHSP